MGKLNRLRSEAVVDATFADFVVTSTCNVDFHPDLTTHISGTEWQRLYDGMAFALRQGIVMNVHVAIVWDRLGILDDRAASRHLTDFGEVLLKYAAKRGRPCAYAYTYERKRDEGLHTHFLCSWLHDERVDFGQWVANYMCLRIARVVVLDPRAVATQHKRDNDVDRHWLWFAYITKGAWPEERYRGLVDRHRWGRLGDLMRRRYEDCGVVRCHKRVGVSRNVDVGKRQQAGFVSSFMRGDVTKESL